MVTDSRHELSLVLSVNLAVVALIDLDVELVLDVRSHFGQNRNVQSELEPDVVLSLLVDSGAEHAVSSSLAGFQGLEQRFLNGSLLAVDFFSVLLGTRFGYAIEHLVQLVILHDDSSLLCDRDVVNLSKTIVHTMEVRLNFQSSAYIYNYNTIYITFQVVNLIYQFSIFSFFIY